MTALRAATGTPRAPRVSVARFHASLKRFHGRVADPAYRKKLEKSLEGLPDKQKVAMRKDIEAVRDWAAQLVAALKA